MVGDGGVGQGRLCELQGVGRPADVFEVGRQADPPVPASFAAVVSAEQLLNSLDCGRVVLLAFEDADADGCLDAVEPTGAVLPEERRDRWVRWDFVGLGVEEVPRWGECRGEDLVARVSACLPMGARPVDGADERVGVEERLLVFEECAPVREDRSGPSDGKRRVADGAGVEGVKRAQRVALV